MARMNTITKLNDPAIDLKADIARLRADLTELRQDVGRDS